MQIILPLRRDNHRRHVRDFGLEFITLLRQCAPKARQTEALLPWGTPCACRAAAVLSYFHACQRSQSNPTTSASARIIAAGIVIAFCYWASTCAGGGSGRGADGVFSGSGGHWLEKLSIPRALGSLIVVLITLSLVGCAGMVACGARGPVRRRLAAISRAIAGRQRGDRAQAGQPPGARFGNYSARIPAAAQNPAGHRIAIRRFRDCTPSWLNLYPVLFAATFIPFLLFFMLAAKRQVWHATMQLFPAAQRNDVKEALEDVTQVLRSYLAGTTLVGLILVLTSWLFFWEMGLDFPFLTALVSGSDESGSVSWSGSILGAAITDGVEEVPHGRSLHWNCRDADFPAHHCGEPA